MYDSPAYVWAIIIAGPKAWRPLSHPSRHAFSPRPNDADDFLAVRSAATASK